MKSNSFSSTCVLACFAFCIWLAPNARVHGAGCLPPPPGLKSWWTLENNAVDTVGTNGGVLSGDPAFGTAKVGNGMIFDGADDSVRIPGSANLDVGAGNGLTIE